MMQSNISLSTLLNGAALLLFGLALLPLLVLSFHNHPSAVDDFCFADTALKHGVWQAQKFYYDGWAGRYFSNLIVHTSPLVWGWYDAFRLIPALLVLGWTWTLYLLISELMPTLSVGLRLVATGILFFLYMLAIPSTMEGFFWLAAAASYTIPTILTFYLIVVIIRWYRLDGPIKTLTAVWAAFLIFAIVGSSETNLVWMLLFLGGVIGYQLLFQRKLDWFFIGMLIVALFSTWLLFRAPGNKIRMSGNEHGGNFFFSVGSAFVYLAGAVGQWLVQTPVLVFGALWVPIARRLARTDNRARMYFAVPLWLAVIAYVGLLAALIFPSYYGIGIEPPPRVMNLVFTYFLIGFFYVLTVWVVGVERRGWLGNRMNMTYFFGTAGLAVLWVAFSLYRSVPLKRLYSDWISGRAATYDREMTARQQVLRDPAVDTVRLVPLSAKPVTMFNDDLSSDRQSLWNRCEAGYYGKKVIILESPTANRP
ncbi:DUF6056 family protein [Larkinella soli]|uniref:DUF6056 family protein n=1 Tax=Larkinella soli TaxID=1770527 RepID=UPI001E5C8589|nr:DUF6056 family protein [Larkinella soli]